MKRRNKKAYLPIFLLLLTISILALPVQQAFASTSIAGYQRVFDDADVLSTTEIERLEALCIEYGEQVDIEIYILTHDNPRAINGETYLEDYNDTLPNEDRVLLLMDLYNREAFIQGYGLGEIHLHSGRINAILDDISPLLSDGDYASAFENYILKAAAYMEDTSDPDYDHNYNSNSSNNGNGNYNSNHNNYDNFFFNIWFQIVVSLAIGGITVAIMANQSGGKMTTNSNTYLNQNQSGLIGKRDIYLRTRVTRVRKPETNTNSKGGFNASGHSGGRSSGGRSHSSGSRKF